MMTRYKRGGVVAVATAALALTTGCAWAPPTDAAAGSPVSVGEQLSGVEGRMADVAEQAVHAVVHIAATHTPTFDPRLSPTPFGFPTPAPSGGVGSGVLVDPSGIVLTNNHVVEDCDEITVTLDDGRKFHAAVVGTDPDTDLAALRLEVPAGTRLPTLGFGDSDRLRLGEIVLAIGNPFGLAGTVTMGIVSAKGRADIGLASYEDFLQTDAAINPGNSGGALVNLRGEVVGINTAIESFSGGSQGVGFSIPSNMASDILHRLLRDGRVVRGYLGVGIQDVDPAASKVLGLGDRARGALVNHVEVGTPGAAAGVQVGDVITAVDGQDVRDAAQLRRVLSLKGAGTPVELGLVRQGRPAALNARLTELPGATRVSATPADPRAQGGARGMVLRDARDLARQGYRGMPESGVIAEDVVPGSDAWRAGLRPGDLIASANQGDVQSARDVERALSSPQGALLLVRRGDVSQFVFVPPSP